MHIPVTTQPFASLKSKANCCIPFAVQLSCTYKMHTPSRESILCHYHQQEVTLVLGL